MKRFACVLVFCLFAASVAFPADAMAVGLGFYGTIGRGEADWEEETTGLQVASSDTEHFGGGFLFDAGASRDSLFNYRLSIGYERIIHEDAVTASDVETDAAVMTHDFGIALMRNQDVKVWFGPEIYLSYAEGTPDAAPDFDIEMLGYGGGPVLGINLNHPDTPHIIALKAGYIFTKYEATGDNGVMEIDYTIEEQHYFFTAAFIFRFD